MKKILYLFLALLLPALIFVFLKFAGKNEFNIPVYHAEGVKDQPPGCDQSYSTPYRIVGSLIGMTFRSANVIMFPSKGLDIPKFESKINDEFGQGTVQLFPIGKLSNDEPLTDQWKKCVFLLNDPFQTVLIDSVGSIRGYYDLRTREEEDRLRVELKILLKRY